MKRIVLAASSLILIIVLFAVLLTPQPAQAGGVVGTGTPGSCTDVKLTQKLGGGGLVTFNCGGGVVTIVLTHTETITRNTTLEGSNKIILSSGGATRIFYVSAGVSLNIKDLTLSNGNALQGGAIFNDGQLTIANSTLLSNTAPGGLGGAIYNNGMVTIAGSTLSGNVAGGNGVAGAIYNVGTLTIRNSSFSGNIGIDGGGAICNGGNLSISNSSFDNNQSGYFGGAIYNNGMVTISGSNFISNSATLGTYGRRGGGIYNGPSGGLTVDTSTLANNSAPGGTGGGIHNRGQLTLTADTLSGNTTGAGLGGGLYTIGYTSTMDSSTINGNSADYGGGIYIDAAPLPLIMINSTVSGNYSNVDGGGIYNGSGTTSLFNVTVANNHANADDSGVGVGGGVANEAGGTFNFINSIIALNENVVLPGPFLNDDDCAGTITSQGYSILYTVDSDYCTVSGSFTQTNPQLGSLQNNGGRTQTHALLPSSPAINAGTNVGCPATDQRGYPRLGKCDIGAYEFALNVYLPLILK